MDLLIVTQKLDLNDDLLGFMHGWVEEFAKQNGKVTVIALGLGRYTFGPKVKVLSLGKESGQSKLKYILRFYKYIWQERNNYDKVFVHMNKEYILLGGIFWRFWGKRVALWYNHKRGNWFTGLAGWLSNRIFCTSPHSFFARWPKARLMPVGIDTELFKLDAAVKKIPNSILFLGRLSPVKNPDILIEALNLLKKQGLNFKVKIIGDAPKRDQSYGEMVKKRVGDYGLDEKVKFENGLPNWQTPPIYSQHEIFINLTPAGSMDKTIFEAMACESLVLVTNKSLEEFFSPELRCLMIFKERDIDDLAAKLSILINLPAGDKELIGKKLRQQVLKQHGLNILADKALRLF